MISARRSNEYAAPTPIWQNAADARLEASLNLMTLQELNRLLATIREQLRFGLPSTAQLSHAIARHDLGVADWVRWRQTRDETHSVVMLLGALSVAIAWMTYERRPAPPRRLQEAIARIGEQHNYLLPIPRGNPCTCGSGGRFSACHGKMPAAATPI